VTLKGAFFDVGDTLVEHWAPTEKLHELLRVALRREFGEREWYERWLPAEIVPAREGRGDLSRTGPTSADSVADEALRQETLRWYEDWFRNAQIGIDDVDMDRLRSVMCVPLDLVSTPVPGAFPAVRWCKEHGLKVALVTNTLSRGDEEVWEDWRRFGLADAIDAVASSHSVGWQKPHRAIFERALALTGARAEEVVMIGDRTDADILGAKRLGMRAVLRRTANAEAMRDVGVAPDAVIDDLTTLPGVLSAWIDVPNAQRPLQEGEHAGR
jgi:FMN phosphatase YigB (HAD superfamily)